MILVDANILLYAEDVLNPLHERARSWWDEQLSGSNPVYLCWTVLNAFIRIGTNPRVFENPLSLHEATRRVGSWLEQPCVRLAVPTDQHWTIYRDLLMAGKATANFTTDAHLAALATEYGCTLCSTDSDFSRFRRLTWMNPLGT